MGRKRLNALQVIYLARHGETGWSLSGQHTGLTDLPLTQRGECNARRLGERLKGLEFAGVFTSPLQRALRTCELAGFGPRAEIDRDLVEWHYGDYEGLRTADIRAMRPDWELFRDGFPGGESLDEIGARADRVVNRVRSIDGAVLIFSSAPSFECWPRAGLALSSRRVPGIFSSGTAEPSALRLQFLEPGNVFGE